jgi:hypothetical protein
MSVAPLYDKIAPDHDRGLSASLWRNSLQAYAANDPAFGVRITDDFTEVTVASATTTPAVTRNWSIDRDGDNADGTVTFDDSSAPDGVAILASNTTSGDDGVTAQYVPAIITLPTHTTAASRRGRVVFEARVDDIDVAEVSFIGLSEAGDQFLDGDSLLPVDQDYIGFYTDDHGATLKFVMANDNNAGTAVTDEITIPDSDLDLTKFQKLGFAVNPDSSVEVCVNGKSLLSLAATLNPLALPIETLTPRLCALTGAGSDAPNLDIDRLDVFVANNT